MSALVPTSCSQQRNPLFRLSFVQKPQNKLHHVKDRSLREDQERSGPAAITLSRLRSLAVGLLGRLRGDHAPDKFQAVLANDSLASDLIANPLPQL